MHADYHEDWDEISDDWYDGADEIQLRSRRFYLESCLQLPSANKD